MKNTDNKDNTVNTSRLSDLETDAQTNRRKPRNPALYWSDAQRSADRQHNAKALRRIIEDELSVSAQHGLMVDSQGKPVCEIDTFDPKIDRIYKRSNEKR